MAGVEDVGCDLEVQPVEVGSSQAENGLTSATEDGETVEKNVSLSNGTEDDLPAVMRDRSFSDEAPDEKEDRLPADVKDCWPPGVEEGLLHHGMEEGYPDEEGPSVGTEEALAWNDRAADDMAKVTVTTAEAIATAAAAAAATTASDHPARSSVPGKLSSVGIQYQLAVSPFIKVPLRDEPSSGLETGGVVIDCPTVTSSSAVDQPPPEVHLNGEPFTTSTPPPRQRTSSDVLASPSQSPSYHPWCRQFIESTSVHHSLQENTELRDKLALFRASGWRLESSSPRQTGNINQPKSSLLDAEKEKTAKSAAQLLPADHCEAGLEKTLVFLNPSPVVFFCFFFFCFFFCFFLVFCLGFF